MTMDKYIILPRFQFTSLYKYGEIYVDSENIVSADIPEIVLVSKLTDIFKKLPYFEYDDEYIILGTTTGNSGTNLIKVLIEQVNEIIALSHQAKISIESKVDSRINIEITNWSKAILKNIEDYYQRKIMEKGIDALWKISGFEGEWRNEKFLPSDILNDLILGIRERGSFKSKDKNQKNILIQAVVYDRTEFFPDGYDGYLFDIFEILCNYLKTNYQFKNTDLYPWLLEKYKSGQTNCWFEYKNDSSNNNLKNIKTSLVANYPSSIRWENALAWFLFQKENIQKKGQFNVQFFRTELERNKNEFINERMMAVILLGDFFGYKYFYDALYEDIKLKFFKESNSNIKTETQSKKNSSNGKSLHKQSVLEGQSSAQKNEIEQKKKDELEINNNQLNNEITSIKRQIYTSKTKGKSKKDKMPEISFFNENPIELQKKPKLDNEISMEIIRNVQEEIQTTGELDPIIKAKIIDIVLSILGPRTAPDISDWIILCFERWKALIDQNQEHFLEILLSMGKPKSFSKIKAEKLIEAILKDELL